MLWRLDSTCVSAQPLVSVSDKMYATGCFAVLSKFCVAMLLIQKSHMVPREMLCFGKLFLLACWDRTCPFLAYA